MEMQSKEFYAERNAGIIKMIEAGESNKIIAAKLNVAYCIVANVRSSYKKNQLKTIPVPPKLSPAQKAVATRKARLLAQSTPQTILDLGVLSVDCAPEKKPQVIITTDGIIIHSINPIKLITPESVKIVWQQ